MLHIICLTKSTREEDFKCWFNYYYERNCFIHILDNESAIDIPEIIKDKINLSYRLVEGWPNQYKLYEDYLENNSYIRDGDLVACVDDDEYLWYNTDSYPSLENAVRSSFNQLNCLLIPEILMSTKRICETRNELLPLFSTYRRNDYSSQGKAIFIYKKDDVYKFQKKRNKENGHVPWINGMRYSDVVDSGVSKTTYGITSYDGDLRLYHYHIKSLEEWKEKIERGSAATKNTERKNGTYDEDIKKNIKFGEYNVNDLTMMNLFRYKENG